MEAIMVEKAVQATRPIPMFSLRTHVLILVAFFAALLIIGWGGAILQGMGVIRAPTALRVPMMIVMGLLVLGLVFSAVPVMVMLVLGVQKNIGNENVALVAAALRRQRTIIYVLWSLLALGSLIAIPAAILDGAFRDAPASDTEKTGSE
jgi:hypothetical protein